MVLKFTEYTYYYNENNIKHIYYIPPQFLFFSFKTMITIHISIEIGKTKI